MVDPAQRIELIVNGSIYTGWTDVSIDLSIDELSSAFSVALTERSPEDGASAAGWLAQAGAAVSVAIGGTVLISGYIDAAAPSLSATDHSITITGRSKAADLIDCSATHATGSWSNKTLAQIAQDLASPFGVSISVTGDVGRPFAKFALQPGESVYAALNRAASMRGLLLVSQADGGLAMINPAPTGSPIRIEQGKHFTEISATHDASQRFSNYLVLGQSAGSDEISGRAAAQIRGQATDPAVTRHRPLTIIAEDQGTAASLRARAEWEASVRRAKAQSLSVTLPSWSAPGGALWQLMQSIDLVAPAAYAQGPLMIAAIRFAMSDSEGRTSTLTLAHPDAYRPQPIPAEAEVARIRRRAGS